MEYAWALISKLWGSQRWRLAARILAGLICVILIGGVGWYYDGERIARYVHRTAAFIEEQMAERAGALPKPRISHDPLESAKEERAFYQKKLDAANTSEDKLYYQEKVRQVTTKISDLISEEQKKGIKPSVPPMPDVSHSFLEKIQLKQPRETFRITSHNYNIYSIEWNFTSYLVKNIRIKKPLSDFEEQIPTFTTSDIMNSGRGFRLGGVVLKRAFGGSLVPSNFLLHEFRHVKNDWLETKIILEPEEIFIGFIAVTMSSQGYMLSYQGMNMSHIHSPFPLSMKDNSFHPTPLKSLSDKYGIVSVISILGPFIDPNNLVQTNVNAPQAIAALGDYLDAHYVLAFKATESQEIEHIAYSDEIVKK